MKRDVLCVLGSLGLLLGATGCQRKAPPSDEGGGPPPSLSPEQASEARHTIVTWLECEECESGELEAVVKLGQTAVPTLAVTLREGPSPASRERVRRHLIDTYNSMRTRDPSSASLVRMGEDEYVKMYMDNYVALYQVRAATGLAAIGGAEARRSLEQAGDAPLRDDVRAVVKASLGKVAPR